MTDKSGTEIVGREGLASNVAGVASQLSALEKSMTAGFQAMREIFIARMDAMESDSVA